MGIEGYYEDYFDDRQEKEKLTNFQKIKNMSLDEMAEFIAENINCGSCCLTDTACPVDLECDEFVKQWLQEESEG